MFRDRFRTRRAGPLGLLAGAVYRLRHRGRSSRDVWDRSIEDELAFWRTYARDHREEMLWRNDPTQLGPLDRPFWEVVAEHPAAELAVLDVGAGPITPLAKEPPGKRVTVTAVDALAEQ